MTNEICTNCKYVYEERCCKDKQPGKFGCLSYKTYKPVKEKKEKTYSDKTPIIEIVLGIAECVGEFLFTILEFIIDIVD